MSQLGTNFKRVIYWAPRNAVRCIPISVHPRMIVRAKHCQATLAMGSQAAPTLLPKTYVHLHNKNILCCSKALKQQEAGTLKKKKLSIINVL